MISFKSLARFKQAVATRRERVRRVCHERPLKFQSLESRRVLAVATWDGGGLDNKWTTAANWEGDTTPKGGSELLFPSSASRSVWAKANWNGDGEFDSGDIMFAFQRNVYVLDEVIGAIAAREERIDTVVA